MPQVNLEPYQQEANRKEISDLMLYAEQKSIPLIKKEILRKLCEFAMKELVSKHAHKMDAYLAFNEMIAAASSEDVSFCEVVLKKLKQFKDFPDLFDPRMYANCFVSVFGHPSRIHFQPCESHQNPERSNALLLQYVSERVTRDKLKLGVIKTSLLNMLLTYLEEKLLNPKVAIIERSSPRQFMAVNEIFNYCELDEVLFLKLLIINVNKLGPEMGYWQETICKQSYRCYQPLLEKNSAELRTAAVVLAVGFCMLAYALGDKSIFMIAVGICALVFLLSKQIVEMRVESELSARIYQAVSKKTTAHLGDEFDIGIRALVGGSKRTVISSLSYLTQGWRANRSYPHVPILDEKEQCDDRQSRQLDR